MMSGCHMAQTKEGHAGKGVGMPCVLVHQTHGTIPRVTHEMQKSPFPASSLQQEHKDAEGKQKEEDVFSTQPSGA